MKKLLSDVAHLSGLRDRHDMDFALVKLIAQSKLWCFSSTRLVRAVGPLDDQHWLTLAHLNAQQANPDRDQFWFDGSTLPKLTDFANREAAIVTESVVHAGSGPFTTIFPIDTQNTVCSLLEVESEQALSADTEVLIDSLLRLYENLQGLLDYGEKDTLTELLNRKTFDGAFLRAAHEQKTLADPDHPDRRATLEHASYWLAVIDIDHFKRVNDNFGHLIGDEVLLLLARQMRTNFRFHDQLYRFGGEEFVVLMRCADHADATSALQRFRHKIETYPFPQVGTITISIGFAELSTNDTPSGAFDRADKAVYFAKGHGRNQVCSYQSLVQSGDLTESLTDSQEADFF
jgi:diguanylate cyclase (GGDEF)-like protein